VKKVIDDGVAFLNGNKVINTNKLRQDAIMPEFVDAVLKERNLKAPIGQVGTR
jgi:NitT/TauT family transport system substrate-binding protein